MTVQQWRKKPVTVNVMLFDGRNQLEIIKWLDEHNVKCYAKDKGLVIPTLEGDHFADVGDVVIQGVEDEFYPCKPGIFWKTYEKVS